MTVSSLSSKTVAASTSNYTSGRSGNSICKITPHHMAGKLTAEACAKLFQSSSRGASANYCIGYDGEIVCSVEEENRSWCSANGANDRQAITIECSNSFTGGDYPISDATWNALVELCVDICTRYGFTLEYTGDSSGSLTEHRMFKATACPGEYLHSRMEELAETVNARLSGSTSSSASSSTSSSSTSSTSSSSSSSSSSLSAGTKVTLSNVALYSSSTSTTKAATKSGTYYIWSASTSNGRIRITNSSSNVGVANQVTGWVNVSDISSSGSSTSSSSSNSSSSLVAGAKVSLSKVALYSSSTSTSKAATVTGTYYLWDANVKNSRIRITNSTANVGVSGQVTGWVNVSDL